MSDDFDLLAEQEEPDEPGPSIVPSTSFDGLLNQLGRDEQAELYRRLVERGIADEVLPDPEANGGQN